MARIYTRTGDDGTTGILGGKRVSKDAPIIEASGALDELNALLGVVRTCSLPEEMDRILENIQNDIFIIGTQISASAASAEAGPKIGEKEVEILEHAIDSLEERLNPLRHFILPGGCAEAAFLHLARAVARRAERRCVTLCHSAKVDANVVRYLNRLSDLLFLLARTANQNRAIPDRPSSRNA